MNCPTCTTERLVMTERSGIEIDYCPSCRGVWLDRGELDKLIERASAALAPPAPAPQPAPQAAPQPLPQPAPQQVVYRDWDDDDDDDWKKKSGGYGGKFKKKKSILGEIFDF